MFFFTLWRDAGVLSPLSGRITELIACEATLVLFASFYLQISKAVCQKTTAYGCARPELSRKEE